jgi:hypothetical protein
MQNLRLRLRMTLRHSLLVGKDFRMIIFASLIFTLLVPAIVFAQGKPMSLAELAAYNKPEFKRFYPEA